MIQFCGILNLAPSWVRMAKIKLSIIINQFISLWENIIREFWPIVETNNFILHVIWSNLWTTGITVQIQQVHRLSFRNDWIYMHAVGILYNFQLFHLKRMCIAYPNRKYIPCDQNLSHCSTWNHIWKQRVTWWLKAFTWSKFFCKVTKNDNSSRLINIFLQSILSQATVF